MPSWVWYYEKHGWVKMGDAINDDINEALFNTPFTDESAAMASGSDVVHSQAPFPTQLQVSHHWRNPKGKWKQTIYTLYLQDMYQKSSDNSTIRRIAGFKDDKRTQPFVWQTAQEQHVELMLLRHIMRAEPNEEGDSPHPSTIPPPLTDWLSDLAHVSSPKNGEGYGSQPSGAAVTYDQKPFYDNQGTSTSISTSASSGTTIPPPPGLEPVGSQPKGHTSTSRLTRVDEVGACWNEDMDTMVSFRSTVNASVSNVVPSWHPNDPAVKKPWKCPEGYCVGSNLGSVATDAAHVALPLSATESAPSECQSDDSWTHIQQGKLSNEEYKERLQREMRRINALDLSVPGDVQAVQE
jgi:hypothetical protein